MPAKKTPARKPTKPRVRAVKPAKVSYVQYFALFAFWAFIGLCVAYAIFFAVQFVNRRESELSPQSTAHAAVVNYAHLIASEVCEEIDQQIDAAEEAGEPFTALQAVKVMQGRGEEARKAAWKPVFDGFNALQDEDGSIPYDTARKANKTVRQGLETVR